MSQRKKMKAENTNLYEYHDFWSNNKDFNTIENNLILGSDALIKDTNLTTSLQSLQVSLVVSVTEEPVPRERQSSDVTYFHVEAGDFPDQDLISNFDLCFKVIDTALKKGRVVYVTCGGGVSRSATIVLAFLMKKHQISYSDALKRVYRKRKVFPNEGFIDQLMLYERMKWTVNGFDVEYRRFLLKTLTYQLRTDGPLVNAVNNKIEREIRSNYEGKCVRNYFQKIISAEQNCDRIVDEGHTYCCYFCRTELFTEFNIIGGKPGFESSCSNIFIEPLQNRYWTQSFEQKTGFLKCLDCRISFGAYNWLLYKPCCPTHAKYSECLAIKIFTKRVF